jgi:hypothetical protein
VHRRALHDAAPRRPRLASAAPERVGQQAGPPATVGGAEAADEERGGAREERAANLFDIRRIIGGLFLLYGGLVLTVLRFGASDAGLRRAHGINVDLSVGIALLVVACLFVAWALLRPLGRREREEADAAGATASGGSPGTNGRPLAPHG